jgi:protein TonB
MEIPVKGLETNMKAWWVVLLLAVTLFPPLAFASMQAGTEQPQEPTAPAPPQRIRVGGKVMGEKLVHKVNPAYPKQAKKQHLEGKVRMEILVDRDGKVIETKVLSGNPLLAMAATEALPKWRYKPTLLNGQPVQVLTEVDINFTLR